ncbi:hypothetical protein ES319_A05G186900v1 [Gossypium barbadense]|uniref:Uncharacterized protein n=2 Tax=Gossypium TaxID=3633 RepID=A0A5J5VQ34_GOSBA|nr:hypothetical protein ES319_A05G186900v1 [Gossypium barbadense]TYH17420.1 hypothetical protein ES288_A05G190100v1 [Gossypium darwinii]
MQPAAARHQFPVDEDGGSARPLQSLTECTVVYSWGFVLLALKKYRGKKLRCSDSTVLMSDRCLLKCYSY